MRLKLTSIDLQAARAGSVRLAAVQSGGSKMAEVTWFVGRQGVSGSPGGGEVGGEFVRQSGRTALNGRGRVERASG